MGTGFDWENGSGNGSPVYAVHLFHSQSKQTTTYSAASGMGLGLALLAKTNDSAFNRPERGLATQRRSSPFTNFATAVQLAVKDTIALHGLLQELPQNPSVQVQATLDTNTRTYICGDMCVARVCPCT